MHRTLRIPELVQIIVSHLECHHYWYGFPVPTDITKHTLLSLALTCKDFVEPALDALWCFQHGPILLLNLLPDDLLKTEQVGDQSASLACHTVFTRMPVEDWRRLSLYSRRVKYYIDLPGKCCLTGFAFEELKSHLSTDDNLAASMPLFPNLRELRVHTPYFDTAFSQPISLLPYLIQPTLTYFGADFDGWEDAQYAYGLNFLRCLLDCKPVLETAQFRLRASGPQVAKPLENAICSVLKSQERLRALALDACATQTILEVVAEHKSIETLKLHWKSGEGSLPSSSSYADTPLPALRHLSVELWLPPESCIQFIDMLPKSLTLSTLTFSLAGPNPEDRKSILDTFVSLTTPASLTRLEVNLVPAVDMMGHLHPATVALGPAAFDPILLYCLHALSGLEILHVQHVDFTVMDDATLIEVTRCWPRMRVLKLCPAMPAPYSHLPPSVGFRGILGLLDSCPRLSELEMLFDATSFKDWNREYPGNLCHDVLREWKIDGCQCPIDDRIVVSQFFEETLPNAVLDVGDRVKENDMWFKVQKLLGKRFS